MRLTPAEIVGFVSAELMAARLEGRLPSFRPPGMVKITRKGKNHIIVPRSEEFAVLCGARIVGEYPPEDGGPVCVGCRKRLQWLMDEVNAERRRRNGMGPDDFYASGLCQRCGRELAYDPVEGCSCHVVAPCSACVNQTGYCSVCGWEE